MCACVYVCARACVHARAHVCVCWCVCVGVWVCVRVRVIVVAVVAYNESNAVSSAEFSKLCFLSSCFVACVNERSISHY